MWNCRWLLCLVVIGLATRDVSSMNEQPHGKNDTKKKATEKNKSHDDQPDSVKARDQTLPSSPATIATTSADVAVNANFNVSVALASVAGASTSTNPSKLVYHEQSHSKRHFHRSKLYRKETRSKSRAGLTKSNVASGNLTPFSTDHLVVPTQDLTHNSDNNTESMKLPIESMPRTYSPAKIHAAVTTSHDNSTASSRSLFTNENKDPSDGKFDKLSSGMTVSSGSTENWDNSSTSSESASIIDEKSSSIELMTFTFENVEEVSRNERSTSSNEVMKRSEENSTASTSIGTDHSSSTTIATVQASDRSIDRSKSTSADLSYGGIDRGRNDADEDFIIYSVHTESSRDADHVDNMSKDDSVILLSVTSESSVSKESRNAGSKGVEEADNESNSTSSENSAKPIRPDIDGYSWVSVEDSSNRISLAELVDTLRNVDSQKTRGSYPYSNSTLSHGTSTSSDSKLEINTGSVPAKHPRSLTVSNSSRGPRELRLSTSGDPDINLSDQSFALPVSTLTEKIDRPLELTVPLNIEGIFKARTKNNIVVEDLKFPRPTSSKKQVSNQSVAEIANDEPFRLVLDLNASSESSTERLQTIRRIEKENPFYQRRRNEITLSVSGNSITEPEQCITQRSSAQTPLSLMQEVDRRIEALLSPVISSDSEETEVGESLSANESHKAEADATVASRSAIDEHRGAQSLVSSGLIVFENFEPVFREFAASEETVVPFETEATTADHFFRAFADLEEHCNASSFNVFIPSLNSRESIATVKSEEEEKNEPWNSTTTEDSLYIIEGFGFLKNSPDEVSDIEEESDRRRDVAFDYSETEIYPGYPQPDDHSFLVKLIEPMEFEGELPVKQEPVITADLQWRGNNADRDNDPWWFNDEIKRSMGQTVKNVDTDGRTVLIPSQFFTPKEIRTVPSLTVKESEISGYRIFLLPTVYILIGICVVLVGCSIWYSKVPVKRESNLPKLTYFIQERQGRATEAVV